MGNLIFGFNCIPCHDQAFRPETGTDLSILFLLPGQRFQNVFD